MFSLKDYINYKNIRFLDFKDNFINNTIPDNENYTKYMNAFFLFYIFHESYVLGKFYYDLSKNNLYQIFEYLYEYDFKNINKIDFYGFLLDIFDFETKDEIYYNIYLKYFIPFSDIIKEKLKEIIKLNLKEQKEDSKFKSKSKTKTKSKSKTNSKTK